MTLTQWLKSVGGVFFGRLAHLINGVHDAVCGGYVARFDCRVTVDDHVALVTTDAQKAVVQHALLLLPERVGVKHSRTAQCP